MFLDAREIEPETRIAADLCIIGGGAAGITLARELASADRSVLLLEAGGFESDSATTDLMRGRSSGQPYAALEETRSRFFGGSTNCWAGYCRPLDPIDFEPRDWVPHSGWPLTRADLDPYYARAAEVLGLGAHGRPVEDWIGPPLDADAFRGIGVRDAVFHFGTGPRRMGTDFRADLAASPHVRVVLRANVTRIRLDEAGRAVSGLDVRTLAGSGFVVSAARYILATGGIENARLLLASDDVQRTGIGNAHDLVGRFFMEHPHLRYEADLVAHTPDRLAHYELREVAGLRVRGILAPREGWLRATRSVGFGAQVRVLDGRPLTAFMRQIATASRAVDGWADEPEGAATGAEPGFYGLVFHHEQAPSPASRLTLDYERDALGMRRVHLHWQLGALDLGSMERAHELCTRALGAARVGRARVHLGDRGAWRDEIGAGNHHMGTTRMHTSPRHGVVDADCAVHGVANLFVAGSSVFPTAGSANPTLTILALAHRLADHLRSGP